VSAKSNERAIVLTVAAVQFVNILDFMIVMPLGPDFAAALGIPVSHLGVIGGSYTAAAAIAGIAGSFFLDRFDRRTALIACLAGLTCGTTLCSAAAGLWSLSGARVLAGCFGGPATSISISIIADVVPPERRGRAMGIVMSAFSVASVLGVPAGLELARIGSWRLPFIAVAGLGAAAMLLAWWLLPPLRDHTREAGAPAGWAGTREMLRQPPVIFSFMLAFATMMGAFILVPNLAAYMMGNLGFPRERLGLLYLAGGALSFLAMQACGPVIDRIGAFKVASAGIGLLLLVLYTGFVSYVPGLPVSVIFVAYMLAMSVRNVAYNTLTSRVPRPKERARFLSLRSAVQHMAAATGAFLSARMLRELPGGALDGIPRISQVSMTLIATLPFLFWIVERHVTAQERSLAAKPALEGALDPGALDPGT